MTTPALHIALITETYPPQLNGVANTLGRLCEGLRARGHHVEVIRPRHESDAQLQSSDQLLLCPAWPLPGFSGWQCGHVSVRKLCNRWQRHRPDVLYIATQGPLGLSSLRAARQLGIAAIGGFYSPFPHYSAHYGLEPVKRLLTHYLRWFHQRTHMTLVATPCQRLELQRRGFARLVDHSQGVDGELFHPQRRSRQLREQWGLGEDDIALIHVGRLIAEKNLGLLERSVRQVQHLYPQRRIQLVVVGDGPQRVALHKRLPQAIFCGALQGEALARHYASGDIFVFPGLSETLSSVVLEAMACGLGVVAFDDAAAAQHIQHGHSGALAMPGDESAFIDALGWLIEDSETLRRVRLNARHHAWGQRWDLAVADLEVWLRQVAQAPVTSTTSALAPIKTDSTARPG